jgi:hypothetical protein
MKTSLQKVRSLEEQSDNTPFSVAYPVTASQTDHPKWRKIGTGKIPCLTPDPAIKDCTS